MAKSKSKQNNGVSIDDVLRWIVENKDDTQSMDRINFLSFVGTTKYKKAHGLMPVVAIEDQNLNDV